MVGVGFYWRIEMNEKQLHERVEYLNYAIYKLIKPKQAQDRVATMQEMFGRRWKEEYDMLWLIYPDIERSSL